MRKGFEALNDKNQEEVKEFVKSRQHAEGGFTDRSGKPDFYYSLFGTWLAVAFDMVHVIEKHNKFIQKAEKKDEHSLDEFIILLIKTSLNNNNIKKPSLFQLTGKLIMKGSTINVFYRVFLLVLVYDSLYRRKFLYPVAGKILIFYSPQSDSPCSIHAAYALARSETGLNIYREQEKLLSFFDEGKGFKAYSNMNDADLLSTAVALFALKTTGADLRYIAPDCLEMIQKNYDRGAFLSGDGDETRDLEYTFYGLMALGIIVG